MHVDRSHTGKHPKVPNLPGKKGWIEAHSVEQKSEGEEEEEEEEKEEEDF